MRNRLQAAVDGYRQTVISAGGLITEQEAANQRAISRAGDGSRSSANPGVDDLLLPGSRNGRSAPQVPGLSSLLPSGAASAPGVIPSGPSVTDIQQSMLSSNISRLPTAAGDAAGRFACAATPESPATLTLDTCIQRLSSADSGVLTRLADQWKQLASELTDATEVFHRIVQINLNSGRWTGTSGPAVHTAATHLITTTTQISAQATSNANVIVAWGEQLGNTKSYMESLQTARTSAMATQPPETRVTTYNQTDNMARQQIERIYNPAVTATAGGLSNLTDPGSVVAGVPLRLHDTPTDARTATGGGGGSGLGTGAVTGGGGGGGGGGSSAAPAVAADKAATDPHGLAARTGSGDPATTANTPATPAAANPASAAQSTQSSTGDTATRRSGTPNASPATRSSGLKALDDTAAARAAAGTATPRSAAGGSGKLAGAAGGSGAGAGGGIGGAAASGPEGSLSARNAAAVTAAERATPTPAAPPATGRAGTPGAPMGRSAHPGGEETKQHKHARYLVSTDNGNEIVGDLPDATPPVLGDQLNIPPDTFADKPTTTSNDTPPTT